MRNAICVCSLFLCLTAMGPKSSDRSDSSPTTLPTTAPDISVTLVTTKDTPDGTTLTLANFKGKPLILEFWATWCGPCKPASAHLKNLQQDVGPDKLALLGISTESEIIIRRYLADHDPGYPVATDANQRAFSEYAIKSLPTAAVITPDGRLAWQGSPFSLTKENFARIGANGESQFNAPPSPARPQIQQRKRRSIFSMTLAISVEQDSRGTLSESIGKGSGNVKARAYRLDEILFYLLDTRRLRCEITGEIPAERFDFEFSWNTATKVDGRQTAAIALCHQFGLQFEEADITRQTYVMEVRSPEQLKNADMEQWAGNQGNCTFRLLSSQFENQFDRIILLGESVPSGIFEFAFPNYDSFEMLSTDFTRRYGIEFVRTQQTIRGYRIRPADQASQP